MTQMSYSLFEVFGLELEYMLVDKEKLNVFPASDKLIYKVAGAYQDEVFIDEIAWSNELVLHVVELKTSEPVKSLNGLAASFLRHVQKINTLLEAENAQLLPTGAHPWMNPFTETKLWPYGQKDIYEAYNKIFDCQGHGWSNLQSTHLNLPFANDVEFSKLHTAIRLLLPIIPALSASTPILGGQATGLIDTRLDYYRLNQSKIPSISGHVIPEAVFSKEEYENKIFKCMYEDIAQYDPEKVLQYEWLNSRGAIARFDRNAIEIRILDIQEAPVADIAIAAAIVCVLKALCEESWEDFASQAQWSEQELSQIFLDVIKNGQKSIINNKDYLKLFGYSGSKLSAGELWSHLIEKVFNRFDHYEKDLEQALYHILQRGNLSERILKSLNQDFRSESVMEVYKQLSECLQKGEMFHE